MDILNNGNENVNKVIASMSQWIKYSGQEIIKSTFEVYTFQTRFHAKINLILICLGFRD